MTVKMYNFPNIYISNKYCSFELSIKKPEEISKNAEQNYHDIHQK